MGSIMNSLEPSTVSHDGLFSYLSIRFAHVGSNPTLVDSSHQDNPA